jgi:hypothetical protein
MKIWLSPTMQLNLQSTQVPESGLSPERDRVIPSSSRQQRNESFKGRFGTEHGSGTTCFLAVTISHRIPFRILPV